MTMGCGSSKKIVNESPSDCKVKTTLLPEGNSSRESYSSGNKRNGKHKIPETSGQVRARFHTRVTGKYDIMAMIGEGSFSKVVRVEDRASKQPYAIKMIEIEEGKDVFESELAVLRRVQHPYVVRLFEVLECKNKVYLVMELATGGELLDRIVSRGYFTERDATHVLYMVLEGVRYLHSLGITHRDLKPENLLYYHPGNDSKIMITDFGLSKLKKGPDDSIMETTCGTPEYIAPEILLTRPYTNSVDMWSIGVISYILLSGGMPFVDDNRTRLYRAILTAKYNYSGEPWNDVSEFAKSFIDKLLVLDPDKRMTADEGLKHPWIASFAASSSFKNLHGSISSNWLKSSSRLNSAKSNRSKRSSRSSRSGKSALSKHRSSIPSHLSKVSDRQEKRSSTPADLASALPDSSKLRSSHLKLTRPLFEKLQSAVKEERVDSPASVDSNTSQTSTQTNDHAMLQITATDRSREHGMEHLYPIPPSSTSSTQINDPALLQITGTDRSKEHDMEDLQPVPSSSTTRFCDIVQENVDDSLMLDNKAEVCQSFPVLEQSTSHFHSTQRTVQYPPSLHLPRLSKLPQRNENLLESQAIPFIKSTPPKRMFDPSGETSQMNKFFDEGPLLSKPFAMDIDLHANDETLSSNTLSTSPTGRPLRFRQRMSPNVKRNKVSSSF